MENIKTFKAGKTYKTVDTGEAGSVFVYTIIKRTAKRLTFKSKMYGIVTKGIYIFSGAEWCKPEGTHSMCLRLSAAKEVK